MKDRKKEIERWFNKRKYFNEEKAIKEEENALNRKKLALILEKILDQLEILKDAETNKSYQDYEKASNEIDILRKELFMIHSMAIITELNKVVYNKEMITEFIAHLLLTFDCLYIRDISNEIKRLSGNNISIDCKNTNNLLMLEYSDKFESLKPFFDLKENKLPMFKPFKKPVDDVLKLLRVDCSQAHSDIKNCELLLILRLVEETKQCLDLNILQLLDVFLFQSKNRFKYFLGFNLTSQEYWTRIYCIDKASLKPSDIFFLDREVIYNNIIIKLSYYSNELLIHSENLENSFVKKFDDLNNKSIPFENRFSLYKEVLKELNPIIKRILKKEESKEGSNDCSVCKIKYDKPDGYSRKNYCPNCDELSTFISGLTQTPKPSVEKSLKGNASTYCKNLLKKKIPTSTDQDKLKGLFKKSFDKSLL